MPIEVDPSQVRRIEVDPSEVATAPAASHWSDKLGLHNPAGRAAVDAVEGVTAGAASTMFHGGDLIRRALSGLGVQRVIDNPDVKQAMSAPDSFAGKAGKFVEQAGELAVPATKVANATRGLSLVGRMLAQGAASGAVTAVQTGGDPSATSVNTALGAAGPVLGAGLGKVAEVVKPQRLYQSALKPTWAQVRKEGLEMLDTGLKEQIPISAEGFHLVENRITDLRKQINDGVLLRAAQGRTVDTANVLSRLDELEGFYKQTAAPQEALDTLKALREQVTAAHGKQIPLDVAQQIKINTGIMLRKSYGEMATAKVEGLKQITRGLKEEISNVFPEIATLNERQSKLIGLQDAIYRAVWREENHQMMSLGTPMVTAAGHALAGGPGAVAGMVGKHFLDSQELKSKLAIALSQAGVRGNLPKIVTERLGSLKALLSGGLQETAEGVTARRESTSPIVPALAP